MNRRLRTSLTLSFVPLAAVVLSASALAQEADTGAAAAPNGAGGPEGTQVAPGVTVVQVPAAAPAQQMTPYGPLPPEGFDPNAYLPNSSKAVTDINGNNDSFDLNKGENAAPSLHGSANGSYVTEGSFLPELHTVRRGETLWEISGRYYNTPYNWPRIWSQNPQIQNPHWIYPGDRVRLREEGAQGGRFHGRRGIAPETIFLRDVGYVDDRNDDEWGEVVGAENDVMMLNEGSDVYIQLKEGHDIALGGLLTIFRPIRTVESEYAKGELISIRGTAKIERFNPNTRMIRAKVTEALDVIERGCRVGPVGRRFEVVPPVRSDVDLDAHIIAAIYPYQFYGQNQVVFLDRGEKEGVRPGMRFFAVMRGDPWYDHINSAGQMAKLRARTEDDRPARVDKLRTTFDADLLPDETYAEFRVVKTRDHTSTALVTASKREIERDARLVARKGL